MSPLGVRGIEYFTSPRPGWTEEGRRKGTSVRPGPHRIVYSEITDLRPVIITEGHSWLRPRELPILVYLSKFGFPSVSVGFDSPSYLMSLCRSFVPGLDPTPLNFLSFLPDTTTNRNNPAVPPVSPTTESTPETKKEVSS